MVPDHFWPMTLCWQSQNAFENSTLYIFHNFNRKTLYCRKTLMTNSSNMLQEIFCGLMQFLWNYWPLPWTFGQKELLRPCSANMKATLGLWDAFWNLWRPVTQEFRPRRHHLDWVISNDHYYTITISNYKNRIT